MPQSLSNILVHIIFSTKERDPYLKDPALRAQLHRYMAGILIDENCPRILVGVYQASFAFPLQGKVLTSCDPG